MLRFGGAGVADVYFHDLGQRTIPADAESEVIGNPLAQARGDVFELGGRVDINVGSCLCLSSWNNKLVRVTVLKGRSCGRTRLILFRPGS